MCAISAWLNVLTYAVPIIFHYVKLLSDSVVRYADDNVLNWDDGYRLPWWQLAQFLGNRSQCDHLRLRPLVMTAINVLFEFLDNTFIFEESILFSSQRQSSELLGHIRTYVQDALFVALVEHRYALLRQAVFYTQFSSSHVTTR